MFECYAPVSCLIFVSLHSVTPGLSAWVLSPENYLQLCAVSSGLHRLVSKRHHEHMFRGGDKSYEAYKLGSAHVTVSV